MSESESIELPLKDTTTQEKLREFWQKQMDEINKITDFKEHQLPLARIKKIMKSDEDVRMISAEAPVLFARACELFIMELTMRAWMNTEDCKRKTLQRNDIAMAVTKNDSYDFLIDIVPRDDIKVAKKFEDPTRGTGSLTAEMQQFYSTFNLQMYQQNNQNSQPFYFQPMAPVQQQTLQPLPTATPPQHQSNIPTPTHLMQLPLPYNNIQVPPGQLYPTNQLLPLPQSSTTSSTTSNQTTVSSSTSTSTTSTPASLLQPLPIYVFPQQPGLQPIHVPTPFIPPIPQQFNKYILNEGEQNDQAQTLLQQQEDANGEIPHIDGLHETL